MTALLSVMVSQACHKAHPVQAVLSYCLQWGALLSAHIQRCPLRAGKWSVLLSPVCSTFVTRFYPLCVAAWPNKDVRRLVGGFLGLPEEEDSVPFFCGVSSGCLAATGSSSNHLTTNTLAIAWQRNPISSTASTQEGGVSAVHLVPRGSTDGHLCVGAKAEGLAPQAALVLLYPRCSSIASGKAGPRKEGPVTLWTWDWRDLGESTCLGHTVFSDQHLLFRSAPECCLARERLQPPWLSIGYGAGLAILVLGRTEPWVGQPKPNCTYALSEAQLNWVRFTPQNMCVAASSWYL